MAKFNFTQTAAQLQADVNKVENPDATPTLGSDNFVTSDGIKQALNSVEQEAQDLAYASLMEDSVGPAAIVTFPDGAQGAPVAELTGSIEPIQDLHGQASPYPPNGGKNILPMTLAFMKANNTSGTWTNNVYVNAGLTYTVNTDDGGNITSIKVTGTASSATQFNIASLADTPDGNYILNGGLASNAFIRVIINGTDYKSTGGDVSITIASGDTIGLVHLRFNANASASSGWTFYPMLRLSTEADATFAPYSNICPILGYTGANIEVTGISLFNKAAITDNTAVRGDNGVTNGNNAYCLTDYIRVEPSTQYYLKVINKGSSAFGYAWYDENKNYVSGWSSSNDSFVIGAVTSPATAKYLRCSIYKAYNDLDATSINYPSTDTSYHAYNGTTYSVSWTDEGTVYKGTLEYLGGGEWKVTATHKGVDMGACTWTYNSGSVGHEYFSTPLADAKLSPSNTTAGDYICEALRPVASNDIWYHTYDYGISIPADSHISTVYASGYTDAATFTTAMNGVEFVYPLATPIEYTLTGPDPETLLGDNNIWSNTGDISVKYRCNTALYIEKKLG